MPGLRVNGYDMQFTEAGEGPVVLLLHGSLGDWRYWAPQMEVLAAAGWRVVAPSFRHCWPERWDGQGDTYKIDQHVADTAAFIQALGAGPVVVVGHSRGGHVAFRLGERHPELVRALVLAEPGGELDSSLDPNARLGQQAAAFAAAAEYVKRGDPEGALRTFAEHTGGPGAWDKRGQREKQIGLDNAMTLLGQINEERKPYARAAVEAIRAPTLLVHGSDTQPNFIRIIDAMEAIIPGARVVVVPGASHRMSEQNPGVFNAAVIEFLRGLA